MVPAQIEFHRVLVRYEETAVLSDVHLGLADQLRTQRASYLVRTVSETIDALLKLVPQGVTRIVLNGDVIDDFALRSLDTRIAIERGLKRFEDRYELVLVRGNHDTMLDSLRRPVHDFWHDGKLLVLHGDRSLKAVGAPIAPIILIGHEHPVLRVSDGVRSERFKCFLIGEYGESTVIVQPAAHPDVLGTDLHDRFMSPILAPLEHADVYVVEDTPRLLGTWPELVHNEW